MGKVKRNKSEQILSKSFFCVQFKKHYFCAFKFLLGMKTDADIDTIRDTILKFVPARCIYLFGSYAYGNPTEDSDIDVFVVMPDDISKSIIDLYVEIIGDLRHKKIFSIDLILKKESVFNDRKEKFILERTVNQKGRILYEHA